MTLTLHASGVAKRFGGAEFVLHDVDLTVAPGLLTVVRGEAAAGKSTLVRCLAGAYRLNAGSVRLYGDGEELILGEADPRTVAWLRREHLGLVDGRLVAAPRESAQEAAARSLEHAGATPERARRRAAELLERIGLAALATTPVGLLPAHARRAIAVGRSLLSPTAVLLLDEPTHGLPDRAGEHLVGLMDHARRTGTAVLATARQRDSIETLADHILDLDHGVLR